MSDSIPGYDAWKLRAPEDEPGYWDGREPEPDDADERHCDSCGKWTEEPCQWCGCCDKCCPRHPLDEVAADLAGDD